MKPNQIAKQSVLIQHSQQKYLFIYFQCIAAQKKMPLHNHPFSIQHPSVEGKTAEFLAWRFGEDRWAVGCGNQPERSGMQRPPTNQPLHVSEAMVLCSRVKRPPLARWANLFLPGERLSSFVRSVQCSCTWFALAARAASRSFRRTPTASNSTASPASN